MKKISFALLLLTTIAFSQSKINEGFENANIPDKNQAIKKWFFDESFVGENGIIWSYKNARNADKPIKGNKSIMLASGKMGELSTSKISGGVNTVSFWAVQAYGNPSDNTLRLEIINASNNRKVKEVDMTYKRQTSKPYKAVELVFENLKIEEDCIIVIKNATKNSGSKKNYIVIDEININ